MSAAGGKISSSPWDTWFPFGINLAFIDAGTYGHSFEFDHHKASTPFALAMDG
ncbi:MAG: hypothetical protein ACI9OU_001320 [Candidatus Promineifilaceae bacterium]|jgi:hypothetical protein